MDAELAAVMLALDPAPQQQQQQHLGLGALGDGGHATQAPTGVEADLLRAFGDPELAAPSPLYPTRTVAGVLTGAVARGRSRCVRACVSVRAWVEADARQLELAWRDTRLCVSRRFLLSASSNAAQPGFRPQTRPAGSCSASGA